MKENLIVIKTLQGLTRLTSSLVDSDFVTADTETDGTQKDSRIIGFSVCDSLDRAFYVILSYWDVGKQALVDLETKQGAEAFFASLLTKKLIMHNAIFDCWMIKNNFGVDLMPSVHTDTMLLAHLVDENRRVGLKELGASMFGESARKEQIEMKASVSKNGGVLSTKKYELYKGDADLIAKYGAKDALLTMQIFVTLLPQLYAEGLEGFFYEDETMPLLRGTTYDLNTTGLKIDTNKLAKLRAELEVECEEAKAFIHSEIKSLVEQDYPGTKKNPVFNIEANKQLAWLLFTKLGNTFNTLTKEGRALCKGLGMKVPYSNAAKRQFIELCTTRKGQVWQEARYNPITKKQGRPKKIGDPWTYMACGKESLKILALKYKWVAKLLAYKTASKILDTYVIGIQERAQYGVIRPSFLQHGTTSGRYSSKNPNFQNLPRKDKRIKSCIIAREGKVFVGSDYCLPADTEYLTPAGWRIASLLTETDTIWQVDPVTLKGSFVRPSRIIQRSYSGDMYTFGNSRGRLTVTKNHRMLWVGQQTSIRPSRKAHRIELLSQSGIPGSAPSLTCFSLSDTISNYSETELWLVCMLCADAYYNKDRKAYNIEVAYPRKRNKVFELLQRRGKVTSPRAHNRLETESWRSIKLKSPLLNIKEFDLSTLGSNQADVFFEAISFWDASKHGLRTSFFTTNSKNADEVQRYFVRSGYDAYIRYTPPKSSKHNGLYTVSIKKNGQIRLRPSDMSISSVKESQVSCVTVPLGYIMIKQQGHAFIVGNCQLEPRVFASFSGDERLLEGFRSNDDFYSIIGMEVFEKFDCTPQKEGSSQAFGVKYPALRDSAKVVALSAAYGTTAFKMAGELKCTVDEAQEVIDSYFTKYPKVQELMTESHRQAISSGRVTNLFGRPRRMPEAMNIPEIYGSTEHARLPYEARNTLNLAINHRIQSTGASIMNRASIALWSAIRVLAKEDKAWNEVKIVLQIHDELVLEGPETLSDAMVFILKHCMEETVKLPGVGLVAEPKVAKDLASLK